MRRNIREMPDGTSVQRGALYGNRKGVKNVAQYRKTDWKVHRVGNQLYIRESVVRKPRFEENPEIEYGHAGQGEWNRQRRRNREYAQQMNRRYIGFLIACAVLVFASAAMYLHQISESTAAKKSIETLEAQTANLKSQNDEQESRMESRVNPEEIRRMAIEELGMVYAGKDQVIGYSYEESDYVRQYEDIPAK